MLYGILCFFKWVFRNSLHHGMQMQRFDIELGQVQQPQILAVSVVAAICETRSGSKPLTSYAEDKCCICLEEFEDEDSCWVLVKCDHTFHKACAQEWLKKKLSCPLCRTDITCSFINIVDV
ncbi:Zinc finger, RING-type [Corchorus olitorius]|uniref:Zinc finger, RING-type n=1 Tax=Corchorus olitorius TaxID=93759 RepID=A0A1R3KC75_9ROSI|nr:Zinc finger, RING-type [Corchorus olitorius]